MEGKKISFGFMKTKKADKPVIEEKKDFIECVEEKSIKIVGGEEVKDDTPLVIPLKPNTLVTAERMRQIAQKVESELEESEEPKPTITVDEKVPKNETLEQMAARELMQEAKKEIKVETEELSVPLPAKPIIEGEKESSLDDYESMPIQQFGMAMLRGMGWAPNKDQSKYKQPQLRPKGLGLGADKVVTENQKKKMANQKNEEELTIVKNSFVKITTGKWNGCYGKVVSLDEDNGRVMVDIPIKKETVSLSEFMMHPVTKAEYDKESKVINADTFEEYKRSDKSSQQSSKQVEKQSSSQANSRHREDRRYENNDRHKDNDKSSNGRGRNRDRRRDSSSSEERYVQKKKDKKHKKRYSSNESLSSLSEDDQRRKKKESRRRRSSSEDSSDSYKKSKRHATPDGKRDIDKKRKGKKKKRDRDRSPNYKKHRK